MGSISTVAQGKRSLVLGASSMETDPSVTRLRDGTWLMGISRGNSTELARSSDGVTFSPGATLSVSGGVPELATLADGRLRLYVCGDGIESYVSADSGSSWSREDVVVPNGTLGHSVICDPSRVAGTNLFLFKTAR